jgi:hypothetical protein
VELYLHSPTRLVKAKGKHYLYLVTYFKAYKPVVQIWHWWFSVKDINTEKIKMSLRFPKITNESVIWFPEKKLFSRVTAISSPLSGN